VSARCVEQNFYCYHVRNQSYIRCLQGLGIHLDVTKVFLHFSSMPDCRLHIILERPESARRLRPCERCPCPPRIAKQKQCKHDFAAGDTFDKYKWSHRHFQVEALPPHVLGSALPDTDSLDCDNHDDDNNNDGDGDGNDDDGDNSAGHHDDNGSRDFSADQTDSDNSGTNEGLFAKDEETLIAESGRLCEGGETLASWN
jgi:hypothetical protein